MQVRVGGELSGKVDITSGVLQGEILSPLLFILYLADIEDFFRRRDLRGLNLDGNKDVMMMLYADDLAILAETPADLKRKLKALEDFCSIRDLEINVSKTKIVTFRSGGRQRNVDFLYRGSPIEKVKSYTYLGVPFSSSSLGLDAENAAIGRAAMATGTALSILSRAKSDSWDGSLKLYNGIVSSTLLYGSQVWGIRYIDALERAQTNFFKRLLLLSGCTAGYALRVELGLVPLAYRVVKLAIDWIVRVLDMDQTRLPKVCMVRLMRLYLGGASNVRYNWVHQLAECLGRAGIALSDDILNLNLWRNGQANMLQRYREFLIAEDVARLLNSSSLQCPSALGRLNEGCAPYLRVRGAFMAGRTLAQLRLASNRY